MSEGNSLQCIASADMTFDLKAYLARIGNPDLQGGVATLAAVQRAQMQHITFENIDVLLGGVPQLDIVALQTKLIHNKRGGYCLELNTLFAHALTALGFTVYPFLGRVRRGGQLGGARTHHALVVEADGEEWLCDTGFGGGGPATPLRIAHRGEVEIESANYRLADDASTGETVLETWQEERWNQLYGFDRAAVTQADFEAANFLCARWQHAPFPDNLMMTRLTPTGRTNLFNLKGKRISAQGADAFEITTRNALAELLSKDYGLELSDTTIDRLWQRLSTPGPAT